MALLSLFSERWRQIYAKAVDCPRNDLDDLLTRWRYKTLAKRKKLGTTNAMERRFREVRRRTRPMGVFQDRTSMDRILFAVFTHENSTQGDPLPSSPRHKTLDAGGSELLAFGESFISPAGEQIVEVVSRAIDRLRVDLPPTLGK